ncbi:MAG: signal transduction histidine kinase/tetratricopeptide (TPR) repeat protein [Myxococcota bacterium]|jgi:signal transduction histidine kinase/tetratricopeptide (TPR) repeat protein
MEETKAGDRIGQWRLRSRLGSGSFGDVWQVDNAEGQQGAMKLLPGPPGDELLTLSRICHPSVPSVLDAQGSPRPYMVMAQARGRPLSAMLRHGAAPESAALCIIALLVDALASVHQAGLVHGDIKPDNIVVGSVAQREVMLIDFGMATVRTGGTLQYAAPERLGGALAEPASDVYASGLVLWEMLHGQLPWMDSGISASLSRRKREAPDAVGASDWPRALLRRMLAPDPTRRPTAAELTDLFVARGIELRGVSGAQLRSRAAAIYLARPDVDAAREAWQAAGGVLAICGPPGSGRTSALQQVIAQLQASGRTWIRFLPDGAPWSAVERALLAQQLGDSPVALPSHPESCERASQAAALLEQRSGCELVVVCDDWERLDRGSEQVLQELAWRGAVRICVTGERKPDWADQHAELQPLGPEDFAELSVRLLGTPEVAEDLGPRLASLAGGRVKHAVQFLVTACDEGTLQQRAGRWLLDDRALDQLAQRDSWGAATEVPADPAAAQLGGLVAFARGALQQETLAERAGLSADALSAALEDLRQLGLISQEQGTIFCASLAAGHALRAACPDPEQAHRQLLRGCSADDPDAGWYAVGARDLERLSTDGPAMIRRLTQRCPEDAAALSAAMWLLVPGLELALARADAMRRAALTQDAIAFVEAQLEIMPEQPALWIALARIRGGSDAEGDETLAILERARALEGFEEHRMEAAISEVQALALRGEVKEAVAVAQAILSSVEPEAEAEIDDWLHLALIGGQSMARTGQLPEAIAMLESLPPERGRGRPSRALIEGALGRLLWMAGQPKAAAERMELAAEAGQGLPARERARMLNNVGLVRYTIGERLEALKRWEECLLLMERLGLRSDQVRVHNNLCVGYREVGRWERARQAGQYALDNAESAGIPDVSALAAGNLGDIAADQRDADGARRWYARARSLAVQHKVTQELAELDRREAALAVQFAESDAAARAQAAIESAEAAGDKDNARRASGLLALCMMRDGQLEDAEQLLHSTIQALRDDGAAGVLAEVRLCAAECYEVAGWHSRALVECERTRAYAEELGLVPLRDRADRLRSRIRKHQQRPAQDHQQLDVLMALAVRLAREEDEAALLQAIADGARELLAADRAFVLTFSDEHSVIAARSGEGDAEPSQSIVGRVRTTRREVIVGDMLERGDLRIAESVMAMDLRSAMCVPMMEHQGLLGAIYIDSRHVSDQRLSASTRMLRALASYAAVAMVNGRRLRERAERAARAAEVVHDLRAPVATMMTLADDLVGRGAEQEIGRELLGLGRRALRLAEDLLSDRAPRTRRFDVGSVVEEICRHAALSARSAQQIVCEAEEGVELFGDPDMLRRVLSNLISNAIRYGDGAIKVSLSRDEGGVVLAVRDHGSGIPEEIYHRLFERGVRTGSDNSHGLGTAIAWRMVQEMGGTLEAINHPDGGAFFVAHFPTARSAVA